MQVQEIDINLLKELDINPRKNDKAVEKLTELINHYGFTNPIIVNKDYTVLAGHTRLKACKKLNYDTVPVIFVDYDKSKALAYAIADNKSNELASWDIPKLKDCFSLIDNKDFEFTCFEMPKIENFLLDKDSKKESFRSSEIDFFNLKLGNYESTNLYQFPDVESNKIDVVDLLPFNYCLTAKKSDFKKTVHFYIDDYQFERVWNAPEVYLKLLKNFNGCIAPDFSTYADFPDPLKRFNIYRSRWLQRFWQENGINVITSLVWCCPDSLYYCTEGVKEGTDICLSNVGNGKTKGSLESCTDDFVYIVKKIKPQNLYLYGKDIKELYDYTNVIHFKPFMDKRKKEMLING